MLRASYRGTSQLKTHKSFGVLKCVSLPPVTLTGQHQRNGCGAVAS